MNKEIKEDLISLLESCLASDREDYLEDFREGEISMDQVLFLDANAAQTIAAIRGILEE